MCVARLCVSRVCVCCVYVVRAALYNLYGQGQRNEACVVLCTLYTRFLLTGHIGMRTGEV